MAALGRPAVVAIDAPLIVTNQTGVRECEVDLERIEDEIDGVFCAHLAWRWARRDGLEVYGSAAEGFIVAPPPAR